MNNKPKINQKSPFNQGTYRCLNNFKYLGDPTKLIFRSSWEKQFMKWCDLNPAIKHWASEEVVVKYISPIDNKEHRYFLDFFVEVEQRDGSLKRFLVEIKPYKQTIQPQMPKRMLTEKQQASFKEQWKTFAINQAKWKAAIEYCERRGWTFVILTEKQLFRGQ